MKLINRNFPRLKLVSRPTAWQVLTFSVLNILLGAALFTTHATASKFFIINNVTTLQFWGITFFSIGVISLFSYVTNRWWLMRIVNIPALFIKLFWLIALLSRQISEPGSNVFLILLFAALASLQMQLYLYFPTEKEANAATPVGNLNIPKEVLRK